MPIPPSMHLALYHPVIPNNTGTIGRLCVGFNTHLHLIGPCGFSFDAKALRRAGLDYWPHLGWTLHETETEFLHWLGAKEPWLITKYGVVRYDQGGYREGDVLILGNENTGLPDSWLERWSHRTVTIPMLGPIRSHNQANAASIVLASAMAKSGSLDRCRDGGALMKL